ncbi:MAG: sporulation protein YqfD [Clostridia bacterium]|nr:sporulation protein YqfD [Clostridia bacterium]
MKRIFLFFIGYARLLLAPCDADAVTKMCFELKIPVFIGHAGKFRGTAVRGLTVKLSDIKTLYRILDEAGISPLRERRFGVPALFSRYKLRFGIFAGAILTAFSLFLAGKFVWRIEIVGNESVSDEDIIAQLDAVDFRLGTYINGVDFDEMHNVLLMNSENLSWISVNMRGSVAYVEVREYSAGNGNAGSERTDGACANIISSLSGTVTQVSVREGRSAVKIGDEVTKGQLLITGVMEYTNAPTRYVYAEGEVFVRTERSFTVTVPLETEILVETDDVIREYGIKFFSKEIFFGIGGSIDTSFYDTIIMYRDVDLFGTVKLPVSVITVTHTKSESNAVTLTEAEAAAAAYTEYHAAFIEATEEAELLAYQTEAGMNEAGDAYVITCVLTVIADAALTLEFEVTP